MKACVPLCTSSNEWNKGCCLQTTPSVSVLTFSVELQGSQQADRFQHFCDVHFQTALQLDEEPADLRADLPIFRPERQNRKVGWLFNSESKVLPTQNITYNFYRPPGIPEKIQIWRKQAKKIMHCHVWGLNINVVVFWCQQRAPVEQHACLSPQKTNKLHV